MAFDRPAALPFDVVSSRESQRVTSRLAAALFALLLSFTMVSSWSWLTVSHTDRWVATLHPLAGNRIVTAYLAHEGATTIVRDLEVEHRIVATLPQSVAILAPTLTSVLQQAIESALVTALRSRAFQHLWDTENRLTHKAALALLDGSEMPQASGGRSVVLDITPIVRTALQHLDANGVTFLDPLTQQFTAQRTLSLQILDVRELHQAQRYYHLATSLSWLFPLLSVLCGVSIIVTAHPRRHGLRRLGLVAVGAGLVSYALLSIGIAAASTLAPTPPTVTSAILSTITSALSTGFLWVSLGGALLVGLAWLSGPTSLARAARRCLSSSKESITPARRERTSDIEATDCHQWTTTHRRDLVRGLQVANVVVAVTSALLLWRSVATLPQLVILAAIDTGWYWIGARARRRLARDSPNDL